MKPGRRDRCTAGILGTCSDTTPQLENRERSESYMQCFYPNDNLLTCASPMGYPRAKSLLCVAKMAYRPALLYLLSGLATISVSTHTNTNTVTCTEDGSPNVRFRFYGTGNHDNLRGQPWQPGHSRETPRLHLQSPTAPCF